MSDGIPTYIAPEHSISDGIPRRLGYRGLRPHVMPSPPRASKPCAFPDDTISMRKVQP